MRQQMRTERAARPSASKKATPRKVDTEHREHRDEDRHTGPDDRKDGETEDRDGTGGNRFQQDTRVKSKNRPSASSEADSAAESSCGSVPSREDTDQGSSDAADGTQGPFLQDEFVVPGPVLDCFEKIYGDYHRDTRIAVAHIMACQDRWTAIGFDSGKQSEDDFVPLPASIRNQKIPQSDPTKLAEDGLLERKLIPVGDGFGYYKPGHATEYRVPHSILMDIMQKRMRSLRHKTRYDLMSFAETLDKNDARVWSPSSTKLTNESGHASPKKDTTMREVMERMDQMRVDFEAMETFADTLRQELSPVRREAKRRFEEFKSTLPEVDSDQELTGEERRQYRLYSDAMEMAYSRQGTASSVVANTAEQVTEWHDDGTATARIKLEQQEPWPRISHVGTQVQSGSRELKTCAFAGVEAYNCDLDSCFDRILRALLREAGIRCPTLNQRLESDGDWKQEIAEDCGVSRGTVKSFAHRTKFAVRPPQPNPAFEKPARAVMQDVGEGWEQSFEGLKSRFEPVFNAVRQVHEYLAEAWLEANAYPAGDGKYVSGETGARMRVDNRSGDDLRKDLLTFRLFDAEQLFMQTLVTVLHERHDVATYSLEHDGIVTAEPIPDDAIAETKERTGLDYMQLDRREPIRDGYVLSEDEADPSRLARLEAEEQREKVRKQLRQI
ncbi:MAG: hypothetical protein ABEL04_04690 [Salinibacter sp.]|uniref:hypothetical protein n=1 Tax=Salinibacter sp. TaxID=2065818 RepID=UPI0035D4DB7A